MSENHIEVMILVGRNARDARSYGRYCFSALPRVGEEVHVDLEQGGSSKAVALKVTSVSHFPVSLEAPMGPVPSIMAEYVMILCAEI